MVGADLIGVLVSPPSLEVPASVSAQATGSSVPVTFTATGADAFGIAVTVTCDPASGSAFPVGSTTVGCTANDAYGNSTSASFVVTVSGKPGTPTSVVAVAGVSSATVSWVAPSANGSPLTGFTVTATPTGATVDAGPGATSATIGGLQPGVGYTFTVLATNLVGTGPQSAPSNEVVPSSVAAQNPQTGSSTSATGTATATSGPVSATGLGQGTVTVATYPTDPQAAISDGLSYLDVSIAPGSSFTSVTVTVCGLTAGSSIDWWNPVAQAWQVASSQTVPSGSPLCATMTVNTTTAPSLAEMYGTALAVVGPAGPAGPTVTSAAAVSFTVGSAGSFTVTTSGSPSPSLTESGALPKGMTFVDNKNGTASLSGTPAPTAAGTYILTITTKNSAGTSTQALVVTVSALGSPPQITSTAAVTFTVGSAGSFTVKTKGSPPPSLTESGALPAGVSFVDDGNGTATLAGTPGAGSGGTYSLTLTATNGAGSATQTLVVSVDQPPAVTSAAAVNFTVGSSGSFTVTTSGYPSPSLTESGALPKGVTFVDNKNGTASLSGTPAPTTAGTYTLTITAKNSAGTSTQTFVVTVSALGSPPQITSTAAVTFTVGSAGSFTVTTSGSPAPSLTESGALPKGVTFVDNKNGTARLSGTPAAGTPAVYALTITASSSSGTTTEALSLSVVAAGPAPTFTSAAAVSFTVGSAGSFTVKTKGSPPPSLTESGALPAGVSFVDDGNGTATLAGTPGAGSGGTYSLTLTATNGTGSATQTLVVSVDQPPAVTSAAAVNLTVGSAGSFTVTTTGFPNPSLTESGALPKGMTFVDNKNGTASLSGTPAPTAAGTYILTITAKNSAGTSTQTLVVTVSALGSPPQITSTAAVTFTVGSAGSFTVKTKGSPPPSLTESGALPAGVSFVDDGNGTATLAGTPGAGSGGTYSLTVTATNGTGTATQTLVVSVDQPPAVTSAAAVNFTVGSAGSFTVTTSGFPNPSLTESGALPKGVTFVDNKNGTASLSGTPAPTAAGTYTLTITAKNSAGTSTQKLVVTVSASGLTMTSEVTPEPGVGAVVRLLRQLSAWWPISELLISS